MQNLPIHWINYRYDQWQQILAMLIALARTKTRAEVLTALFQMRYSDEWRAHVPMGRPYGRSPKPPFHQFRDYRFGSASHGPRHLQLFANKGINSCQLCNGQAYGGKFSKLDYFAFYKTNEIFTWTDPAFLNGFIPYDPRHEQPDESPLILKWICWHCYRLEALNVCDRLDMYQTQWERYKMSFAASLATPPTTQRVLLDRRVSDYDDWTLFSAAVNKGPAIQERRVQARRNGDVVPQPPTGREMLHEGVLGSPQYVRDGYKNRNNDSE